MLSPGQKGRWLEMWLSTAIEKRGQSALQTLTKVRRRAGGGDVPETVVIMGI